LNYWYFVEKKKEIKSINYHGLLVVSIIVIGSAARRRCGASGGGGGRRSSRIAATTIKSLFSPRFLVSIVPAYNAQCQFS
jgi:hypothetical protein